MSNLEAAANALRDKDQSRVKRAVHGRLDNGAKVSLSFLDGEIYLMIGETGLILEVPRRHWEYLRELLRP